jgi:hypothetical protein
MPLEDFYFELKEILVSEIGQDEALTIAFQVNEFVGFDPHRKTEFKIVGIYLDHEECIPPVDVSRDPVGHIAEPTRDEAREKFVKQWIPDLKIAIARQRHVVSA